MEWGVKRSQGLNGADLSALKDLTDLFQELLVLLVTVGLRRMVLSPFEATRNGR